MLQAVQKNHWNSPKVENPHFWGTWRKNMYICTLPETNSSPLKIGHPKRRVVSSIPTSHFQGLWLLVSGRVRDISQVDIWFTHLPQDAADKTTHTHTVYRVVKGGGPRGGGSLMFPKAPQSSQTESLGFPSYISPLDIPPQGPWRTNRWHHESDGGCRWEEKKIGTMIRYQLLPSDLFGDFKWPVQGLSDLHLGYQKVTGKNLVISVFNIFSMKYCIVSFSPIWEKIPIKTTNSS